MTNIQEGDKGKIPEPEKDPFDPRVIEFKVVEHLDWDAWGAVKDPDTGEERGGRFRPGHRDNKPLAGLKLKIEKPDGTMEERTTDKDGVIRLEVKEEYVGGKCAVTFGIEEKTILNNTYVLFYETLRLVHPRNWPQNRPTGDSYEWRINNLMVGRSHLLSIYRPPVIIDGHMHIQSGRCAPMPMVWDKIPLMGKVRIKRSTIENLDKIIEYRVGKGTEAGLKASALYYASHQGLDREGVPFFIFTKIVSKKIGEKTGQAAARHYREKTGIGMLSEAQKLSTFEIAQDFISSTDPDETWPKAHRNWLEKEFYKDRRLIMPCMVQTMDMEYAHLDGYFGIKVYNGIYDEKDIKRENPKHYWFPLHRGNRAENYRVRDGDRENDELDGLTAQAFSQFKEAGAAGRSLKEIARDGNNRSVKIQFEPCLVDDEETTMYEQWKDQVAFTEQAVLSYPLKLLPMYHFDPRRWQGRGVNKPFQNVENQGIYFGFKMYTAQGFRPLDSRLPVLEDFYDRCQKNAVPILNHCTPKGAYTFDRKEYIWFTHPNDTDEDDKQKEKYRQWTGVKGQSTPYYLDPDAEDYFNEYFVSPRSWEPVLKKWPRLHLCLAHFGGDSRMGKTWAGQLIEMMPDHPNLFADISSCFTGRSYRRWFVKKLEKHPILAGRVMFGTDWYLILGDKVKYPKFHQEAREILDAHDTSLWNKFTVVNPCRFYNLPYVIDRVARNIIKMNQKAFEERQEGVKELKPKQIEEIHKDATYLRETFQVHEAVEYTHESTYRL